ncbi:MAG: type II toxin-antitoxin system VapC family toxin [Acidimicrobiia bacterium]|nr:type II toxin-antitoxin system VapC family toxin [Acidimicrobiia bacterium]
MSVLLDAGALIALERGDRLIGRRIHSTRQSGILLKTHGGVIAQVWRGGRDQARLARALRMVETFPLNDELGRKAGVLLARSGLSDAIDAALVAMAEHGDEIITSDPDDLDLLVTASQRRIDIVPL